MVNPRGRRPRLAIVGASVRAAAQSALRAGFQVVGADLFADADLDGVCPVTRVESYPWGLRDWLAVQEVDAWMYTGAFESYPECLNTMAELRPLWGIAGQSLRVARDPLHLQRTLPAAGLAFPETHPADGRPHGGADWLAKPYSGGGGEGVRRRQASDGGRGAGYHQRLVAGTPMAAVYAASPRGGALLGLTEQLIGDESTDAPDWGYGGSIGPIEPSAPLGDTLRRLGRYLVEDLGLTGLVGVDLIVQGDNATVIEINPRYTASVEVLEGATGLSALAAHRAACCGERTAEWPVRYEAAMAKRYVFARRDVLVTEPLAEWLGHERAAGRLADAPRPGDRIPNGRPVCTLLARASNPAAARVAIAAALADAESRLYGKEASFSPSRIGKGY